MGFGSFFSNLGDVISDAGSGYFGQVGENLSDPRVQNLGLNAASVAAGGPPIAGGGNSLGGGLAGTSGGGGGGGSFLDQLLSGDNIATLGSGLLGLGGQLLNGDDQFNQDQLDFLKDKFGQEFAYQQQKDATSLKAEQAALEAQLESAKNDRVQKAFAALLGALAQTADNAPKALQSTAGLITKAVRG